MIKIVKRGFEMRFHPDEYFEMDVFPIPKGVELYDGCVYYNQLYKKQIGNAPNWKEKFNRLFN
jgi:hypothetical protein